ncbi:unnamed protein product [Symbiodinium natans]|uniref:Uncharacterized protein n=1 Tax=Symbiodinium natans TaxID=878477 RepID=A0A812NTU4_9DINO|nr:unnamed protein product [Symbiodinium natans]
MDPSPNTKKYFHGGDGSRDDCSKLCGSDATGWYHPRGDHIYCFWGGQCNIFTNNGLNWGGPVMDFPSETCTVLVSKVSGGWEWLTCTMNNQDYKVEKGTSKSQDWANEPNFAGAASMVSKAAGYDMGTQTFSESIAVSQKVPLRPKKGKQVCLWQWTMDIHGPPSLGTVLTKAEHFQQTSSKDLRPKCIPGYVDPSDPDAQTCLHGKYA